MTHHALGNVQQSLNHLTSHILYKSDSPQQVKPFKERNMRSLNRIQSIKWLQSFVYKFLTQECLRKMQTLCNEGDELVLANKYKCMANNFNDVIC